MTDIIEPGRAGHQVIVDDAPTPAIASVYSSALYIEEQTNGYFPIAGYVEMIKTSVLPHLVPGELADAMIPIIRDVGAVQPVTPGTSPVTPSKDQFVGAVFFFQTRMVLSGVKGTFRLKHHSALVPYDTIRLVKEVEFAKYGTIVPGVAVAADEPILLMITNNVKVDPKLRDEWQRLLVARLTALNPVWEGEIFRGYTAR